MGSASKRKENESKRRNIQIMMQAYIKEAKGLNGCFHFVSESLCGFDPLKKTPKNGTRDYHCLL